jgi:hypothetical protein
MVNRSIIIKNPYTPVERRISDMKNSLYSVLTSQDANIPAKTTMEVSMIIATEIPSTPVIK